MSKTTEAVISKQLEDALGMLGVRHVSRRNASFIKEIAERFAHGWRTFRDDDVERLTCLLGPGPWDELRMSAKH